MAKAQLSLTEERDENQRAMGCVGLSAFAHVGLLIAIFFAPSLRETAGIATGTKAGLELPGEAIVAAANGTPSGTSEEASKGEPVEVMLADANDPTAVAMAPTAQAPEAAQPAAPPPPEPQQPAQAKQVTSTRVRTAKPVESTDIASAIKDARTESAKPAPAAQTQPQLIETADESDVEAPTQAQAQPDDDEDEAVPLQVALPEDESLTQAQANALQAPGATTDTSAQSAPNTIPADAQPLEQVQTVRTTGAIITRPANSAPVVAQNTSGTRGQATDANGLPNSFGSQGSPGTVSGTTQSRGGTQGVGVPFGAQVRDARTLEAMPGNPLATYPLPDRIANREGTTILLGHVRNDGRVENVTLEQSSGSRLMDESAAKAFSKWKYRPGQEGYVRLPMQFKLVGDAHVIPAQLNRE